MKKQNEGTSRRDFFKIGGLSTIPLLIPPMAYGASSLSEVLKDNSDDSKAAVNFIYDGPMFSPQDYLAKLNEIDKANPIEIDYYSSGGVTKALEEEFARITGKEKAIYLPTGTMANQLAIKLLNGNNTKVIVPDNSHVFRDEADAAQSVHNLRLIPLGKDKAYFDLNDVEHAIQYLDQNEVFKSGLGTVMIENPIRRADGTVIPFETIVEITNYCREQGYKLHLDGARLHIASAYSKVPVSEYASHFDTVYISLYKYLNAGSGAMLCGDAAFIDQIPHQIKILGGTMLRNWSNTAMALHYLNGIDQRWQEVIRTGAYLISELNKLDGVTITAVKNGSNVFDLKLAQEINPQELTRLLFTEYDMRIGTTNEQGLVKFKVNETLLSRDPEEIIHAWKAAIDSMIG
jgi:threonine aldolase